MAGEFSFEMEQCQALKIAFLMTSTTLMTGCPSVTGQLLTISEFLSLQCWVVSPLAGYRLAFCFGGLSPLGPPPPKPGGGAGGGERVFGGGEHPRGNGLTAGSSTWS